MQTTHDISGDLTLIYAKIGWGGGRYSEERCLASSFLTASLVCSAVAAYRCSLVSQLCLDLARSRHIIYTLPSRHESQHRDSSDNHGDRI